MDNVFNGFKICFPAAFATLLAATRNLIVSVFATATIAVRSQHRTPCTRPWSHTPTTEPTSQHIPALPGNHATHRADHLQTVRSPRWGFPS